MKPTNDEKLQVVEAMLKMHEHITETVDTGDQKLVIQALASATSLMLTGMAMLLVEKTAPPDPSPETAQLLLFPDVDADD